MSRGASDEAVAYLRRALSEPPPTAVRAELLLELGKAEASVYEPDAGAHLREAAETATEARHRADAVVRYIETVMFSGRAAESIAMIEATVAELASADRDFALRCEPTLFGAAMLEPTTAEVFRERLAAHELGDGLPGETAGERAMLLRAAVLSAQRGDSAARTAALATRSWRDGALLDDPFPFNLAMVTSRTLSIAGELEIAADVGDRALSAARIQGSAAAFANVDRTFRDPLSDWRCRRGARRRGSCLGATR